jgi:hypothetical protein
LTLIVLTVALWPRRWRMLRGALLMLALAAVVVVVVVILPGLWLSLQTPLQSLQIQLSGACLLLLMLVWPLAVLVSAVEAARVNGGRGRPTRWRGWHSGGSVWAWRWAPVRRWLPTNMLVYTLDRAFISTAAAAFICDMLMQPLRRLVGAAAIAQAPAGRWVMA